MRRVAGWIVAGLPLDARSRRAFDETLLDWAHEDFAAPSATARLAAAGLGLLALWRLTARTTVSQVAAVPSRSLALRTLLLIGMPAAAMWWWTYTSLPSVLTSIASKPVALELSGLAALHGLEAAVPVLVFVAIAWPSRASSPPALGLAASASIGMLFFTTVLEPWGTSTVSRIANALLNGTSVTFGAPGASAYFGSGSVPSLTAVVFGPLAFKVGLAGVTGAVALLAIAVRDQRPVFARGATILAPMLYAGTLRLAVGGSASYLLFHHWLVDSGFARWSLVGLALVCLLAFVRATTRRPWLLLVPGAIVAVRFLFLPDDWLDLYRVLCPAIALWTIAGIAVWSAGALTRLSRDSSAAARTQP